MNSYQIFVKMGRLDFVKIWGKKEPPPRSPTVNNKRSSFPNGSPLILKSVLPWDSNLLEQSLNSSLIYIFPDQEVLCVSN